MSQPADQARPVPGAAGLHSAGIEDALILIVEDRQEDLDFLRGLLAGAGYRRIECERDPRQVAERYRAARPDLVLLDLDMAGLDALAVLEELRALEQKGWVTVLVLAARSDSETRIRALDLGARDVIGKPVIPREALARIRNLLEVVLLSRRVADQNVLLEQAVSERTRELREAQLEIVQRLAAAAESRDHSAGPHLVRMSLYSAIVAACHGWPTDQVDLLRNASPLHDVGKIGIPDAILLKPGPLTDAEWGIMRQHTTIGAAMLGGGASQLIRMGEIIALSHHERWDGSGYPAGLAGEAIPAAARICSVCDVFDAMTSDRCYHGATGAEAAAAYIDAGAGNRFDPAVVASFRRALPEILKAREAAAAA